MTKLWNHSWVHTFNAMAALKFFGHKWHRKLRSQWTSRMWQSRKQYDNSSCIVFIIPRAVWKRILTQRMLIGWHLIALATLLRPRIVSNHVLFQRIPIAQPSTTHLALHFFASYRFLCVYATDMRQHLFARCKCFCTIFANLRFWIFICFVYAKYVWLLQFFRRKSNVESVRKKKKLGTFSALHRTYFDGWLLTFYCNNCMEMFALFSFLHAIVCEYRGDTLISILFHIRCNWIFAFRLLCVVKCVLPSPPCVGTLLNISCICSKMYDNAFIKMKRKFGQIVKVILNLSKYLKMLGFMWYSRWPVICFSSLNFISQHFIE